MRKICILSDFDGTVTEKDGLYAFFNRYASTDWLIIEKLWEENKISSKTCLFRQLNCIPNLNENLIDNFIATVKIDKYFKNFYEYTKKNKIDFYIVSDGIDYFIQKTLKYYDISEIKVISNHFELSNGKFNLTFPNDNKNCTKNSGTCKCNVLSKMRDKYEKIIYIGDGTSDFCVSNKPDLLFAKDKLFTYCQNNNINCIKFNNFNDISQLTDCF